MLWGGKSDFVTPSLSLSRILVIALVQTPNSWREEASPHSLSVAL